MSRLGKSIGRRSFCKLLPAGIVFAIQGLAGALEPTLTQAENGVLAEGNEPGPFRNEKGDDDYRVLKSLQSKAFQEGRYADSLTWSKRICEHLNETTGPKSRIATIELMNLGEVQRANALYDDAEKSLKEAASNYRNSLGTCIDAVYITCHNNLVLLLVDAGKSDEAVKLANRTVELAIDHLGSETPESITSLNNLAVALRRSGRLQEARETLKLAMERCQKPRSTADLSVTILVQNNLAEVHHSLHHKDLATKHYSLAMDLAKQTYGEKHPHYAMVLNNWIHFQLDSGKLDGCRREAEKVLKILESTTGTQHPYYGICLNTRAAVALAEDDFAVASDLASRAVWIITRKISPQHPACAVGLRHQAQAAFKLGMVERAFDLVKESRQIEEQLPLEQERLDRVKRLEAEISEALRQSVSPCVSE